MSYLSKLGNPKTVLAPMVDHCDLAFRLLTRDYGCDLCYTAMFHSRSVVEDPDYINKNFQTDKLDRPLIVQLNGNNPEYVLKAAQKFETLCDGIDLNLGCPQNIAKRGGYGAYLLPKYDLIYDIITHVVPNLKIPFSCKIRLLPNFEDTKRLVHMIEKEGCQLLTVHGRTKEQNKDKIGECDWEKIKLIKSMLSIPVFANGGIECYDDINRCISETGVDGVMIGEAILEDPTICQHGYDKQGNKVTVDKIINQYLDYAILYKSSPSEIRAHLFKLLYRAFKYAPELRETLGANHLDSVDSINSVRELVNHIKEIMNNRGDLWLLTDCTLLPDSWYMRHRQHNTSDTTENEYENCVTRYKKSHSSSQISNSSSSDDEPFSNCLFGNSNDDDDF